MKKILWFALILFMSFAFVACEEEGPSMNEDYAGTWYIDTILGVFRYDLTDTTYVTALYVDGYGYIDLTKGTITKLSETTYEEKQTHENNGTSWDVSEGQAQVCTYSLSADGHTLTVDGDDYTDTDPAN